MSQENLSHILRTTNNKTTAWKIICAATQMTKHQRTTAMRACPIGFSSSIFNRPRFSYLGAHVTFTNPILYAQGVNSLEPFLVVNGKIVVRSARSLASRVVSASSSSFLLYVVVVYKETHAARKDVT